MVAKKNFIQMFSKKKSSSTSTSKVKHKSSDSVGNVEKHDIQILQKKIQALLDNDPEASEKLALLLEKVINQKPD